MVKKPRIAFCFSWQARTLEQTYLFFQENLFDVAKEQGFSYDVFCAVEDDEDIDKVNLLNPTKVEKIKSSEVKEIIENKYWWFIKSAFKTKYKWVCHPRKVYDWAVNYLQQVYKICKSIKLCGNIDDYDIIIRLRFDVIFINKLNFSTIYESLKNWNNIICNDFDEVNFIAKFCRSTQEIQDLFFIWNSKSMKCFWDLFDNFEQCFLGHEVKTIFKPIYYLSNVLYDIHYYIYNNVVRVPMIHKEFWAYMIFIPEKACYEYFLYHKINVIRTNISLILLRRDVKKSYIELRNKSIYEI